MLRSEAEQKVRMIQRICRGTALLPEEVRITLHTAWSEAHAALDYDGAVQVVQVVEEAIGKSYRPSFLPKDWIALSQRAANALFAFSEDCGLDFNDIICSNSFDGKEHDYKCPKCGQTGTYRAPLFDGVVLEVADTVPATTA